MNKKKFGRRLHLLVTDEHYEFVKKDLNGGIAHHVRSMIEHSMKFHDKELSVLEKEFVELEPRYLAMKHRIDELKSLQKRAEVDKNEKEKTIEHAKTNLLEVLKNKHNRVDKIPSSIFKFYSDLTGQPAEFFKVWLEEEAKKL